MRFMVKWGCDVGDGRLIYCTHSGESSGTGSFCEVKRDDFVFEH